MLPTRRRRFTVRGLMAAIVLAALATWGRSAQYALKAEAYLNKTNFCKNNAVNSGHFYHMGDPPIPPSDWMKERVKFFQIRADHAERLYRKYRLAAMLP